ncbi:hypothetical protein HOM50_04660 [bacterium]|nr:hypothetical protein [bacterium]MBT5015671.1 hypothetical protein [bacterium]
MEHYRFTPIPLGVASRQTLESRYKEQYSFFLASGPDIYWGKKEYNVLSNFRIETNSVYRNRIHKIFKKKPFTYRPSTIDTPLGQDQLSYLQDLKESRFVLSPKGNGLDFYRHWEALYLGCIPILTTSLLDGFFKDLPVLIINDWKEVTEDLLDKTYDEFSKREFNYEKLDFKYWKSLILSAQEEYKATH